MKANARTPLYFLPSRSRSFLVLLFFICLLECWAQSPLSPWTLSHPAPTGQSLYSVAHGTNGFIAIGKPREVLQSADGIDWRRVTSQVGSDVALNSISYWRNEYVMPAGADGYYHSGDGIHWNETFVAKGIWPSLFVEADGKSLIVGNSGALIIIENDGSQTISTCPAGLKSVAFANGIWVALDYTRVQIFTSSDLQNWVLKPIPPLRIPESFAVTSNGSEFVAVGGWLQGVAVITYSVDGVTWNFAALDYAPSEAITGCTFANGKFMAIGPKHIYQSNDGITWKLSVALDDGNWQGVEDLHGLDAMNAIAASEDGALCVVGPAGTILTSSNPGEWRRISSTDPVDYFNLVASADGKFVAIGGRVHYIGDRGYSITLVSTNCTDWTSTLPDSGEILSGLAHGNGLWVVCGDDGLIFTSPDAVQWTNRSLPATSHDLYQMTFGNGRFIAFSQARDLVYSSTNTIDWISTDTPYASEVVQSKFLNGRFVTVGYHGNILQSEDGLAWSVKDVAGDALLRTVCYGKGRYVAAGDNAVAVSLDGDNWEWRAAGNRFYDVQFCDGWFIGAGDTGILTSRDGINWDTSPSIGDEGYPISALAYNNHVLVGISGLSLLRTTVIDSEVAKARLNLLYPPQLEFFGRLGFDYQIQRSDDLIHWISEPVSFPGSDNYVLSEPSGWGAASSGFWRVKGIPN